VAVDDSHVAQYVRILPSISGRFVRSHRLRPDSAKTYGNLMLETGCRNTDEFPVSARAALIGGLMVFQENGWDYETTARVIPQLFCAVR
jgi:hypothetical protein